MSCIHWLGRMTYHIIDKNTEVSSIKTSKLTIPPNCQVDELRWYFHISDTYCNSPIRRAICRGSRCNWGFGWYCSLQYKCGNISRTHTLLITTTCVQVNLHHHYSTKQSLFYHRIKLSTKIIEIFCLRHFLTFWMNTSLPLSFSHISKQLFWTQFLPHKS